jgi:hypothetical protein
MPWRICNAAAESPRFGPILTCIKSSSLLFLL